MLTEKQVPYTGPYGQVGGTGKSKGPTAEALKRALSRMGYLSWADFDQNYNLRLETAFDKFDPGKNGYGNGRWLKIRDAKTPKGEYALDRFARTLIQNEAGVTSDSTDLETFQKYFTEFFRIAVQNASKWHYDSEHRPVSLNINPAAPSSTSDCSGSGIQGADYARRKANLLNIIQDPAKQNWTGYGNTDWFEDDWPKVGSPYRVGDAAHFQNSRHVCWCIKPGTTTTAEWWTFGHEPPSIITLATYSRFPGDFMFIVRPVYIKE